MGHQRRPPGMGDEGKGRQLPDAGSAQEVPRQKKISSPRRRRGAERQSNSSVFSASLRLCGENSVDGHSARKNADRKGATTFDPRGRLTDNNITRIRGSSIRLLFSQQ